MVRVIIDTNFLMVPYQYNIDIFTEIERAVDGKAEFCIIDLTQRELSKLMESGTMKERMAAKLGNVFITEFLKQKRIKIIHTVFLKDVDTAILRKVGKHDYVATQDKELKEKLKNEGIKVITLFSNHCVVEHK